MESERETRKRRIDPLLKAAGWTIVPFSPTLRLPANENLAIEEYPTADGPADYAVPMAQLIMLSVSTAKSLAWWKRRRLLSVLKMSLLNRNVTHAD